MFHFVCACCGLFLYKVFYLKISPLPTPVPSVMHIRLEDLPSVSSQKMTTEAVFASLSIQVFLPIIFSNILLSGTFFHSDRFGENQTITTALNTLKSIV
ncbi:hypothetical protein ATZ36_13305 [Candidatus Endomicrobiellum trichonymphae]|jgi:hypothetical protein|uniref:Uncharacterized protein n=1 Tax=Endomicrobium trichonymphae TaxID=1408204 RepID=A0A1E5IMI3_ENDTX|nr:hypothetical protein ATZ36_13305 [Candidatus Endomicrobium trichonymphae]